MVTISIEKETRERLKNAGRKEQTYNDIIMELLEEKKGLADSPKSAEQL